MLFLSYIDFSVQVFWPLPSQGYCRLLADGSDDSEKDLRTILVWEVRFGDVIIQLQYSIRQVFMKLLNF